MTTDIDGLIPSYPCGNCGKELGKSYAWMKSHDHFTCGCGARNEWLPDDIIEGVLCQNSALLKDHGCNLMHRKVLASFYQHLMAEAPMRSV